MIDKLIVLIPVHGPCDYDNCYDCARRFVLVHQLIIAQDCVVC